MNYMVKLDDDTSVFVENVSDIENHDDEFILRNESNDIVCIVNKTDYQAIVKEPEKARKAS